MVEDAGLVPFLSRVVSLTSIADYEVSVLGGSGWTAVYGEYDSLLERGFAPDQIVPVLDGDTAGKKPPRSNIISNPNVFRFAYDLEFAFAAPSDGMLLDHALLLLMPGYFGQYGSVSALRQWSQIVQEAYQETARPGGKHTTLENVRTIAKRELVSRPEYQAGFQLPSKVELAKVLAELCIASGAVPRELAELLWTVHGMLSGNRYRRGTGNYHLRTLWLPPLYGALPNPAPANALEGQVLLSPGGIGLEVATLSTAGVTIAAIPNSCDLGWGAWLPDGRIVATLAGTDGVAISSGEDGAPRQLLRTGLRESYLCCQAQEDRILLRDNTQSRLFSVSIDNRSWTPIAAPGYNHCVNSKGLLAWTPTDGGEYREILVRQLHDADATPLCVPDVIDARHSLAWSHSGRELAFVNGERYGDRRTICVWNRAENRTRFITPWIGRPRFVAWSPDDRYLLVSLEEIYGLYLVDVRGATELPIPRLHRVCARSKEDVFLCGAWRR